MGTAAVDEYCIKDGHEACATCNDGYHLDPLSRKMSYDTMRVVKMAKVFKVRNVLDLNNINVNLVRVDMG